MEMHGYSSGDSLGVTAEVRLQFGGGIQIVGFKSDLELFVASRLRAGIIAGNQKKKCLGRLFDVEVNFGYEAGIQWDIPIPVPYIELLSGVVDFAGGPFVPYNLGAICGPVWPAWLPHPGGNRTNTSTISTESTRSSILASTAVTTE